MREPMGSSSGDRNLSGSRASPAKTTQSSCLLSSSLLARMRSSLRTVVRASWASSMMRTGRQRLEPMWSAQRVQGLEAGPTIVGGERDGEEVSELAVEVHGAALGMLDGADEYVRQGAKALGEQAQSDAFPGPWIAGEHGESAVGDPELDAPDEAVDGGGSEERLVGNVRAERVKLQSVEREQ